MKIIVHDYQFFMGAIPHDQIDKVQEYLVKYIDASASYIIAMETAPNSHKETKGQHMHFAVQMDDKQYDLFRRACFTNYYKLRGKAIKDLPRQYGKIKHIRDETKFLSYTVKDKNIVYRNIDLETINQYIERSHPKQDFRDKRTQCMDYLKTLSFEPIAGLTEMIQTDQIEQEILKWHMDKDEHICKTTIKSLTRHYLQIHYRHRIRDFKQIYAYTINN